MVGVSGLRRFLSTRAEGEFVPLSAALESLGVDPREVEALLADRAGGAAA